MVRPHRAIRVHLVAAPAEVEEEQARQVRRPRRKASQAPLQPVRLLHPGEVEALGQPVRERVVEVGDAARSTQSRLRRLHRRLQNSARRP